MAGIDISRLASLLRSPHGDAARAILLEAAADLGFESQIKAALIGEGGAPLVDQAALGRAVQQLEWITRGRGGQRRECMESFFSFADRISSLGLKAIAATDSGRALLSWTYLDGGILIESPAVRAHIEGVMTLLGWMGTSYLRRPAQWGCMVHNAYGDFERMTKDIIGITPRNDNPYLRYKWLVQISAQRARTILEIVGSRSPLAEGLEEETFALNRHLEAAEFHDILQIGMEIWVRLLEAKRAFNLYEKHFSEEMEANGLPDRAMYSGSCSAGRNDEIVAFCNESSGAGASISDDGQLTAAEEMNVTDVSSAIEQGASIMAFAPAAILSRCI